MIDTNLHPILTNYIAWIKAHEKLLIIVLGAFLVFHFYGDVLNVWTEHDKRQIAVQQFVAQTAQQKTQADSQQNVQLLQQLADLKLQYSTLSAQVQVSMQSRSQKTKEQKKIDDTSTAVQIAARFSEILRLQSKEVNPNADGSITFTESGAHTNINVLEDGLQAKADVVELTHQVAVCAVLTAKQDETIQGVRKELTDEKVSHKEDVKLEQDNTKLAKDEGKKSFRRGFKWGAITGFVGGILALRKI